MAKARRQDVRGVIDCSDGVDGGEASLAGAALNRYGRTGAGVPPAATVGDEVVYIVNPRGCVHECTREHARWRLARDPRYRYATEAEVAAYKDSGGNQMYPSVSGKPFVV